MNHNYKDFAHLYNTHAEPKSLLDVRTTEELEFGSLPNAHNIPLGQLEERLAELNSSTTLFVFCGAGKRAARAAQILNSNGFNVHYACDGGYAHLKDLVN